MALGLYPDAANPDRLAVTYSKKIDEIAALGASHVALVVSGSQRDIRSNRVDRALDVTVSDALLRKLTRRAHRRGMKVVLFPIVTLRATRPGQWRGTITPSKPAQWWLSYERFILHYAKLAASESIQALLVGSELGSTESWRQRWHHLIGQVRGQYRGTVIYSSNWDHYQHVSFWRRLDVLGISSYFTLTSKLDASTVELTRAWRKQRAALESFIHQRSGVALWLTEVGYVSRDGTATRPWDYNLESRIDLEEQRRCFVALRSAWAGSNVLQGLLVWNWFGSGGPRDGSYTPKGKPAERVLRDWWN